MIYVCTKEDIQACMDIRLEMLKEVFHLPEDYLYSEKFIKDSYDFFLSENQMTIFSMVEGEIAGCATLCKLTVMPTIDHPTGKRGHLMNVYTRKAYRKRGLGKEMVTYLLDWAGQNGYTEMSLDSTQAGRKLYESCGFQPSDECMVIQIKSREI